MGHLRRYVFDFELNVDVDSVTGAVRAAYMRLRRGDVAETSKIRDLPDVLLDRDKDGMLLGVEILAAVPFHAFPAVCDGEPFAVYKFLTDAVPRGLVQRPEAAQERAE